MTLVLLTRDGCMNTPRMAANLESALGSLGRPGDYSLIDIGDLPPDDARTGYPTPTLLAGGRDVFDLPVPTPPFDVPS